MYDSYEPTNVYSLNKNRYYVERMEVLVQDLQKTLNTTSRRHRIPVALMDLIQTQELFDKIVIELEKSSELSASVQKDLELCKYIVQQVSKFGYEYESFMRHASQIYDELSKFTTHKDIWQDIPEKYWVYFMEILAKCKLMQEQLSWEGKGALSVDTFYLRLKRLGDLNESLARSMILLKERRSPDPVASKAIDTLLTESRKLYKELKIFSKLRFNSLVGMSIACDEYLKGRRGY